MLRSGSVLLFLYSTQTSWMSRLGGGAFGIVLCVGLGIVRVLPVRWAPLSPAPGRRGAGGKIKDATFTYRPRRPESVPENYFFSTRAGRPVAPGIVAVAPSGAVAGLAASAATFSSSIFCAIAPTTIPTTNV